MQLNLKSERRHQVGKNPFLRPLLKGTALKFKIGVSFTLPAEKHVFFSLFEMSVNLFVRVDVKITRMECCY